MTPDPRPEAYRLLAQYLREQALDLPQPYARAEKHELARQYDRVATIIEQYEIKPQWDSLISN
jgi:hypothetical protein